MKALVTGSGGLIGSACVDLLCSQGWDVIGIDNIRAINAGDKGLDCTGKNCAHNSSLCHALAI